MSSHESGKHKGSRDSLNQASICPTAWGVEGARIKQTERGQSRRAPAREGEAVSTNKTNPKEKEKTNKTMSYDGAQRWRRDRPPHSCLKARGGRRAPGRGQGRASAQTCEKQKNDKPETKTNARNLNQRRQERRQGRGDPLRRQRARRARANEGGKEGGARCPLRRQQPRHTQGERTNVTRDGGEREKGEPEGGERIDPKSRLRARGGHRCTWERGGRHQQEHVRNKRRTNLRQKRTRETNERTPNQRRQGRGDPLRRQQARRTWGKRTRTRDGGEQGRTREERRKNGSTPQSRLRARGGRRAPGK